MNLWAKRIGQLAVLPVALFFFSCEDEAGVLGYKNPNPKFEASYVEFPIESSVLLLDSQRTSNFVFQNETNRLLLGKYVDTKLGTVSADAYTQFFTTTSAKLQAGAAFDSVSLELVLDFYHYGKLAASNQTVSVYQLSEDLKYDERTNYFNRSEVQVNPTLLGSKTFSVDPETLDEFVEDDVDTAVVIKIKLDPSFGEAIFNHALKWRDYAAPLDSTFIKFNSFVSLFKGLAIKSDNADVIIGINTNSAIKLHYHYPDSEAKPVAAGLALGFAFSTNFSQIKTDRSATDLSGLTQYSTDYYPAGNLRYVQAGTGVYTKLDFGKFFEFCDTIPNVIITSAELSITGIESSDLAPPPNFILRLLNNDNHLERFIPNNLQDSIDYTLYNPRTYSEAFRGHTGTLSIDGGQPITEGGNAFYVLGDATPYVQYSKTKQSLSGNFALFFQQLSLVAEQKRRFQHFLLTPVTSVPQTKTVNRIAFNKDNIKLKIYYTKPTTPVN